MLQIEYMLDLVHSKQEEGWQPDRVTIVIYTNPFSKQREQGPIIILVKSINITVWARRCEYKEEDALGIISKDINQINQTDIIPLVDDLEILGIFKDKDKEEGDGIIDSLSIIL